MKKLKGMMPGNEAELSSAHSGEKKLSIRELLEVEGGLEAELADGDCQKGQCESVAVVVCYNIAFGK